MQAQVSLAASHLTMARTASQITAPLALRGLMAGHINITCLISKLQDQPLLPIRAWVRSMAINRQLARPKAMVLAPADHQQGYVQANGHNGQPYQQNCQGPQYSPGTQAMYFRQGEE